MYLRCAAPAGRAKILIKMAISLFHHSARRRHGAPFNLVGKVIN
jgi:hypothetical protein